MSYHRFEPVDPRDAFTVTAHPDDEATQSAAASQAAEEKAGDGEKTP